ncbi:hypothetical protein [Rhodoblastus sp.]|uniref:hypothetical protein n=1 Tax=Rhodoblastus sp. TaxID=1962975 RepID=UPI0026116BD3|nr:hypothetical protein [Rhodoblastus sp.]
MAEKARPLLAAWVALMALSLVLAIAGDVIHPSRLGVAMMLAIVVAAVVKARLVLRFYLGLRAAPGALAGFTSAVALTLAVVVASFLIFPTPH